MLNKKNAAYAVFGFALVGCNNILGACDCCKSVPQALERFTLIFKNLKGFTYKNLKEYFKDGNLDKEKEFSGKDLVAKKLANAEDDLGAGEVFYIVNYEENKNEMKVYLKDVDDTNMGTECKGKKCTPIKIKFKVSGNNTETKIKDDESKKYKVDTVEVEAEQDAA